ncbi:MAG: protein kinase [Myxococcota bacterium]
MRGSESHDDLPPQVVEGTSDRPRRFRLHGLLGRGGHGEVYRATMWREGGVQSEVAVKILSTELEPGSDPVRRLEDEGRILGALDHPVILQVYDLIELGGRVALVTEFVDGVDLHDAIHTGALELRGLVQTVGMVADALHVAWSTPGTDGRPMRLIHRDIKPQNIRLGIHGQVKLLDFGIAQATQLLHRRQGADALMGSGPYLPPERLVDPAPPLTSKVDVWGLGCVLYEGLSGERLMDGITLDMMYDLGDHLDRFQAFVEARLRELPPLPKIRPLLAPMLSIDPRSRPSAGEIAEACDELAESVPGTGLLRWARTRNWNTGASEGPLTSRQLIEGAPSMDLGSVPPPPPPVTSSLTPSAAFTQAITVHPAPLSASALSRWDAEVTGDEVHELPVVDLEIDDDREPPLTPERKGLHPLWFFVGFGLTFLVAMLVVVAFGMLVMWAQPDGGPEVPGTPPAGLAPVIEPDPPAPTAEPKPASPVVAPPEAQAPPEPPAAVPAEATPSTPAPSEAPPNPDEPPPVAPERGALLQMYGTPIEPPADGPASLETSGATVELRGEFGNFRPGTPLVSGDYEVWADFGEGFVDTKLRTSVKSNQLVEVSCSREQKRCFARSRDATDVTP